MSIRKIILYLDSLPKIVEIFIKAFGVSITFYGAAILSYYVSEIARLDKPWKLGLHAGVFIFFFTISVFFIRYLALVREEINRDAEKRRAALSHAYIFIERLLTKNLADLRETSEIGNKFAHSMITSVKHIQRVVEAAYYTFEAAYGMPRNTEERIDFEVTFMTKSYADGKITIPACANREARAPRSMVLRNNNLEIYDDTVTAAIYREPRPSIHIIEDAVSNNSYHELYEGQKERIKSSIVYPVLSDKSELLGTLVVHCDKANFFRRESEKYWVDLMEIFAKNIALAKTKMDLLVKLNISGQIVFKTDFEKGPF